MSDIMKRFQVKEECEPIKEGVYDENHPIIQEAERLGWEVEAIRKVSNNPADDYLRYVLAKRKIEGFRQEYVTWLHNSSLGGFHTGHYFQDKDEAIRDFYHR
jgi:hypothetical protein